MSLELKTQRSHSIEVCRTRFVKIQVVAALIACALGCADSAGTSPSGGSNGTCTPNCAGKICGDDGCGGSCGTCPNDGTPDDTGIGTIINPPNQTDYPIASAYLPASIHQGQDIRAVFMFGHWGQGGTNYDLDMWTSNRCEFNTWRKWAERERVVLAGFSDEAAGRDAVTPADIQKRLDLLAQEAEMPEIATARWLLRGVSYYGLRSWNVTAQQPERVLAFMWDAASVVDMNWTSSVWDGMTTPPHSIFYEEFQGPQWEKFFTPAPGAEAVPGLFLEGGEEDWATKSQLFFWHINKPKSPWVRATIPGRGHCYQINSGELERCFFSFVLHNTEQLPKGGFATFLKTRTTRPWVESDGNDIEAGWVPNAECAQAWTTLVSTDSPCLDGCYCWDHF